MNGLDILLTGIGIIGLIMTGIAVFGKRQPSETVPIGAGSLGVIFVGTGGLSNLPWLMAIGVVLVAGGFGLDWYFRRSSQAK